TLRFFVALFPGHQYGEPAHGLEPLCFRGKRQGRRRARQYSHDLPPSHFAPQRDRLTVAELVEAVKVKERPLRVSSRPRQAAWPWSARLPEADIDCGVLSEGQLRAQAV